MIGTKIAILCFIVATILSLTASVFESKMHYNLYSTLVISSYVFGIVGFVIGACKDKGTNPYESLPTAAVCWLLCTFVKRIDLLVGFLLQLVIGLTVCGLIVLVVYLLCR